MKVITSNKILIIGRNDPNADIFLPLDGKSSRSEVAAFQSWVINVKGVDLGRGGADGKYGPKTKAAWKKYGAEYKAGNTNTGGTTPEPSAEEKKERAKKGQGWDKVKKAWVTVKGEAQKLGLLDLALDRLGLGQQRQQGGSAGYVPEYQPEPEKKSKGLFTPTNIALAVGGVVIIVAIIKFANKDKK